MENGLVDKDTDPPLLSTNIPNGGWGGMGGQKDTTLCGGGFDSNSGGIYSSGMSL